MNLSEGSFKRDRVLRGPDERLIQVLLFLRSQLLPKAPLPFPDNLYPDFGFQNANSGSKLFKIQLRSCALNPPNVSIDWFLEVNSPAKSSTWYSS